MHTSARLVLALAAAFGCCGPRPVSAQADAPAQTAPAQTPPAAPAETLTGLPAWNALVGNTITGRSAGETFSEYFEPGGAVRFVDKDGPSAGTWMVQGGKVCIDFPDDDDRSCPTFEVTGKTGRYRDDVGGNAIHFEILPGNSKGL